MNAHILTYYFSENYLEKREPFRSSHFEHLKPYLDRKEILLGGATADPADKGIIIFDKLSKEQIDRFVQSDPYFKNGVILKYNIQKWTVVAGSLFKPEICNGKSITC